MCTARRITFSSLYVKQFPPLLIFTSAPKQAPSYKTLEPSALSLMNHVPQIRVKLQMRLPGHKAPPTVGSTHY